MPQYRRSKTVGATYFFTVVTYRRQRLLIDEPVRHALRGAISDVRNKRHFNIDAWVLLPDHLHCIWTLPDGDVDSPPPALEHDQAQGQPGGCRTLPEYTMDD